MAKHIKITESYAELCKIVSDEIFTLSQKAIQEKGNFSLVLSGGETPKGVYEAMAKEPGFEWKNIHLFWGDERWAAPVHPDSNYRMVKEALLDSITIPPENINPIRTEEIDPETSASFYEADLKAFFKDEKAGAGQFDLVLLGVGTDGHVASLFPDSESLKETKKWVIPTKNPNGQTRLTLTLPLINQAKAVFVLVSGKKKVNLIKKIFAEDETSLTLPVAKVAPRKGQVSWFLDKDAAGRRNRERDIGS